VAQAHNPTGDVQSFNEPDYLSAEQSAFAPEISGGFSSAVLDDFTPTSASLNPLYGAYTEDPGLHGDPSICYLRGTHILTPTGEVMVENLHMGDKVVTRFGGIRPIRWVGRQSFDARFLKRNIDQLPVRIRAGALGDRLPARDLYVSPGHSMLIGDQLILAASLVNGITITQDWCPDEVHYYQLDLGTHDCVIAEGTFSESFADGPGLRDKFHNLAQFEQLYPNHCPPDELVLCATRPERGHALDEALRPIVARASTGLRPGPVQGWIDRITNHWKIEGWAQDSHYPELPVLLEILLNNQPVGQVLACDYRADLKGAGFGRGHCSFIFTSPVKLTSELLQHLRVRRVSDGAEIGMSEECSASLTGAPFATAKRLRAVA
jgi:hypothetical protein